MQKCITYNTAAAVTILIIGAPLIIVLNNYKSERNEIISPELYAPKAKEMSERQNRLRT